MNLEIEENECKGQGGLLAPDSAHALATRKYKAPCLYKKQWSDK